MQGEAMEKTSQQGKYHKFETHQYKANGDEIISGPFKFLKSWTNEFNGYQNPNYALEIKNGLNASTDCTASKGVVFSRPFWVAEDWTINPIYGDPPWAIDWKETYGQVVFTLPDQADVDGLSEVKADNKALTVFVTKVRRQQTTFQGGTFIAELGKTIRFVKNPVKNLRNGVSRYLKSLKKRGGKRGFRSLPSREKLNILTDTWLEHSFAWRPLITELDDAVRAVAEHKVFSSAAPFRMVRGVGEEESVIDRNLTTVGSTLPLLEFEKVETSRVIVKYYGMVDVGNTNVVSTRRVGLDMSNWLPTLWEVVPWSFLIDYFVNIDNIISAASLDRTSLRWITRTVYREIRHEAIGLRMKKTASSGVYTVSTIGISPGASSACTTSFIRNATYGGSLVPDVEFSIPNSVSKWLNVAALIVSSRVSTRNYR